MTMAKTVEQEPLTYDAETTALVPTDLQERLTGPAAVEGIAQALRGAALVFESDDLETLASAEALQIQDEGDYTRGFDLLTELGLLETRIAAHYAPFDKPLNFLIRVVRGLKSPQLGQVTALKQALAKRLGSWKAERERLDRAEREKKQAVADAAARAAQEAKAAVLTRVAEAEIDQKLAASFHAEAEAVRAVAETIKAAPVEVASSIPVVPGGHTRTTWKCEFVDLKALLTAYIEGRCFLDEDAIMDGLQASLDEQAGSLQHNLSKAYPGTRAVPTSAAVARRKR
jgi:hypothetical protein